MMNGSCGGKRGVFLTIDVAVSLLLMFTLLGIAAYYFAQPSSAAFSDQLLRNYLQDAATVISAGGYFGTPLESANQPDASGIREVLRATPLSVCAEVAAYGVVVRDSLSGYWKLDEDNGYTVADYSGNGLTGVVLGSTDITENGKSGRALSFGGVDDAVNISDAFELNPHNESFSISAWINADAAQGSVGRIFTKLPVAGYPGYSLYIREIDGKAVACYYSTGDTCNDGGTEAASDSDLRGAGWKHVAAVFNRANGSVYMYVDGVLQAAVDTGFASAAEIINIREATIGAESTGGPIGAAFAGYIDEVRLYKKALNQSEVNALYSNSRNLLYVVSEANCTYGGGALQSVAVPFSYTDAQGSSQTAIAVVRGWRKSAG